MYVENLNSQAVDNNVSEPRIITISNDGGGRSHNHNNAQEEYQEFL